MKRSPIIGLSMRLDLENERFYLGRDYSEAIESFGGTPLHISLIPKKEYVRKIALNLDGILLPGSDTDVDPLRFGEEPHPKLKKVIFEKDETDILLLNEAENLGIPVLAICFGMQVLNVSRAGTLFQDINSEVPNFLKHEQGIPRSRNSHSLNIEKGSLLSRLKTSENTQVNSHHHQSIKSIGRNLRATAWAKDGVIECIEDTRKDRFALGVQWHPELSWKNDSLSKNIFQIFVSEALKFTENRR
jgi:putative glutamine amidotransferase